MSNGSQKDYPVGIPLHAGAGGSATTARKRKEEQLLAGLQQLLANIEGTPDRSRSPSPGWQIKGRGKQRGRSPTKRKGKGKGDPQEEYFPSPRSRSQSPKHVTFKDGNGLLAQLKAIVLQAEVGDEDEKLKGLVASFAPEKDDPPPKRYEQKQIPGPRTQAGSAEVKGKGRQESKNTNTQELSKGRVKLENNWWPVPLTSLKKFYDSLDDAEEPPGSLSFAPFGEVQPSRALAQTHNIRKAYAFIILDQPSKEDIEAHKGVLKWCLSMKGQWKKLGFSLCPPNSQHGHVNLRLFMPQKENQKKSLWILTESFSPKDFWLLLSGNSSQKASDTSGNSAAWWPQFSHLRLAPERSGKRRSRCWFLQIGACWETQFCWTFWRA